MKKEEINNIAADILLAIYGDQHKVNEIDVFENYIGIYTDIKIYGFKLNCYLDWVYVKSGETNMKEVSSLISDKLDIIYIDAGYHVKHIEV